MFRNYLIAALAVCFVSVIGNACADDTNTNATEIKTSTVGHVGKLAWAFLGGTVSVDSPDAQAMAARLAENFAKSGYKVVENSEHPTYRIMRDFRGKAANYVPPTSGDKSEGGNWGGALLNLGVSVLIGHQMGLINTSNLLQSNAYAVAETVRQTGDAYVNPAKSEEMTSAAEKGREEMNLVVYRLCYHGNQCAYALSSGTSDLERLDEACFKKGILKLAGQDAE